MAYTFTLEQAKQAAKKLGATPPADYPGGPNAWYQEWAEQGLNAGDPRLVELVGGKSGKGFGTGQAEENEGGIADWKNAAPSSEWLGKRAPTPRELRKYASDQGWSEDFARFDDRQLAAWLKTGGWDINAGKFAGNVEKPTERGGNLDPYRTGAPTGTPGSRSGPAGPGPGRGGPGLGVPWTGPSLGSPGDVAADIRLGPSGIDKRSALTGGPGSFMTGNPALGLGAKPIGATGTGTGTGGGVGPAGEPLFDYTPFKAPTFEEALKEPGYQFGLNQGLDAMQRSAAAQGTLRTGGTLKDLIGYGEDYAAKNYQDVYNRALQSWGAGFQGEQAAFAPKYGAWQTAYGAGLDKWKTQYSGDLSKWLAMYGGDLDRWKTLYSGDLSQWTTKYGGDLAKYLQREQDIYGLLNPTMPGF